VLHWLNAYEEGDEIVLDGYFEEEPEPKNFDGAPKGYERMMSYLDQYKMMHPAAPLALQPEDRQDHRTAAGRAHAGVRHVQPALRGKPYRYAYSAVQVPGWFLFHGYVKHDLQTGKSWEMRLPEGQFASEAPFAPRVNAKDEDDGYLVTFVTNENTGKSEAC
jgi:carotenoid cleavage dioxygenase-like enzyme